MLLSGPLPIRTRGTLARRQREQQEDLTAGCTKAQLHDDSPLCQESILHAQEATGAGWVNLRSGIEGPALPFITASACSPGLSLVS